MQDVSLTTITVLHRFERAHVGFILSDTIVHRNLTPSEFALKGEVRKACDARRACERRLVVGEERDGQLKAHLLGRHFADGIIWNRNRHAVKFG